MNDTNSNSSHKDSEELLVTSTSFTINNENLMNITSTITSTTKSSSSSSSVNDQNLEENQQVESSEETNKLSINDDINDLNENLVHEIVTSSSNSTINDSTNNDKQSSSSSSSPSSSSLSLLPQCFQGVNVDKNNISQKKDIELNQTRKEEEKEKEKEDENKIITIVENNISSNEKIVTRSSSTTMGGASSNNDAETCVLPKSSNYIERINENTKNLDYTRSSSSSSASSSISTSVTVTMSAPTTRSKRKLMNDGGGESLTSTTSGIVAATGTSIAALTSSTITAAQSNRNNSISVNNKLVKLDSKDIKENVKNHQIQPQSTVTTRRSAAAAAAAANSTMMTAAATFLEKTSKTKSSINSVIGKKSDGNNSKNEDNRSIILMRSSTSTRKHLLDKDDGSNCGNSGSCNNKIVKKNNCINDVATEEIEESQKETKKDSRHDTRCKTVPIAINTMIKSNETKDGNNSSSNSSNKNPASSSCDIDDKQLNAGDIRKVEPLKINLNRDTVLKPTKITIKPIVRPQFEIENANEETSSSISPIPKLTIKSSSATSTIITPVTLASVRNDDSVLESSCLESQHSISTPTVHSEPHIVPKLTIRTSDYSNSSSNPDVTHSVVPKLTIKMDCTSNCEKETSSSSTSSSSTSSPSPPPPPLPKLTIKTSGDMSEATILSSSCISPKKSSICAATSTVCHIVGSTSTMTSSLSSSQTSVPKLTIKTIQIPSSTTASSSSCDNSNSPTIPKLTIKPIPLPSESDDSVRTDDESLSETDTSWKHQNLQQQLSQSTIPKLTIRAGGQEPPSVKIHQPELSSNSSSSCISNQSIPKLTIRTKADQETGDKITSSSLPKFTIKSVQETTQSIPKLTISVSDSVGSSSSSSLSPPPEKIPKLTIRQVESDETEGIPKLMISRQDNIEENNEKVPKLTIKTVQEFDSSEKIPKLTIKPLQEPSSECTTTEKLPKLTIKQVMDSDNVEKIPKITIKPLQEPSSEDTEKLPNFKVTVSQSDPEKSEKIPRLTIKQVQQETDDVDKVPKLTISRSVSSIEEGSNKIPKIKIKQIQEADATSTTTTTIEKYPKLTIKNIGGGESENVDRIPKLTVKIHEKKEEFLEKIPKLTIKQIQDSEDGSKSPKLAVFTKETINNEITEKDSLSDESDFLGENPPAEGEEQNIAINSTVESIQENEMEDRVRDGNLSGIHRLMNERSPEIETIVLTDETPEKEIEEEVKFPSNEKIVETEVPKKVKTNYTEKRGRENSIENRMNSENMEIIRTEDRVNISQEENLESNDNEARTSPDLEIVSVESSNSTSRQDEVQEKDENLHSKIVQNVEMSMNTDVENDESICIESDDEKINEDLCNAMNEGKMNEKTVGASFCSSLKEEEVVEALLAVLQQHYQEGGSSSLQVSAENSSELESNLNNEKTITTTSMRMNPNNDSVECVPSDDEIVIVSSDPDNCKTTEVDKKTNVSDMETESSNSSIINKIIQNDFQMSDDMNSVSKMCANIFMGENHYKDDSQKQQNIVETVDLTLSPKRQFEEGYQGTSLLGRLLSQPLENNIMSKCTSMMTTMMETQSQSWLFTGNMNFNAQSSFENNANLIGSSLDKRIVDNCNMRSMNRSNSICDVLNISSDKRNIPTSILAAHLNETAISDVQQHSPATSLENLLNNMSENSIDDIQYVSSVKQTTEEKDVLESLENLKAIDENSKMLNETTKSEDNTEMLENLKNAINECIDNRYDKHQTISNENLMEKNLNEKLKEIQFNVNNNQDSDIISLGRDNLSKDIHRSYNNTLKRPSDESDSSDCIEVPVNKKSRCELMDITNNTIPDSISLDSEAESMNIPSSDCSLNQPTKDVQLNLTENETSSTMSEEQDIMKECEMNNSENKKMKHESTVDLKALLARMHHNSSLENLHTSETDINEIRRTPENIRPKIALIQEGPVRHHSRKSKHNVLINDNEESGSDELVNNITDSLVTTFTNSIYDKKSSEIDSGVDMSGSLQSETSNVQRQPLKRPRGRPRKDGLPAGSVKKLPKTVTTDVQTSENVETPSTKRKYKRRLLPAAESPTSQSMASSAPSDISKDSIPVLTPPIESIPKRSDTPSALSSCSIPSPAIPHLTPEIPTTSSSENVSPTSTQPTTSSSSSSSFPMTPSPKAITITSTASSVLTDLTSTISVSAATKTTATVTTATSTTTTTTSTISDAITTPTPLSPSSVTPKGASSSKRGGRGGRGLRGRNRGGLLRNRPRCIGGLSHTPEIVKDGPFFSPERRKVLETQNQPQQSKSSVPQVFEEDTRMSADSIVTPTQPINRQSETNNEDTRSSVLSSASIIEPAGINVSSSTTIATIMTTSTTTTTTTVTTPIVVTKKKSKSKMEVIAPEGKTEYTVDMIAEYDWPPPKGCCPAKNRDTFMIQEQIAQYLGIKSFKRKYPDLPRRQIDMEERNWLQEKGLVTEKMCDLGITAVWASDVLDIMYSDFYDKYEEYKTYIRQKHLRDVEAKQKALAADAVDRTLQARDRALQSAAKWNSNFNRTRKEDRRLCLDLQNLVINIPEAVGKKLCRPNETEQRQPPSHYPIALVPGQFSEYYRHYTPEELRQYPVNTVLDLPDDIAQRILPKIEPVDNNELDNENESNHSSDSESDSDSNSDSDSDVSNSNSDDNDSDSSSSSDDDEDEEMTPDQMKCFVCHQPQNKNLHGFPEVFVRCYTCRRQTHPSCIDMPHRMATRTRNYNWQCAECKCCIKCKRKMDESKMIYCEQCDRGYHIYCVRIKSVPEGRWNCEHCAICMRCGSNKPEGNVPLPPPPPNSKWKPKRKWIHEYRVDPITKLREHISILCAPCARLKRNPKPPS